MSHRLNILETCKLIGSTTRRENPGDRYSDSPIRKGNRAYDRHQLRSRNGKLQRRIVRITRTFVIPYAKTALAISLATRFLVSANSAECTPPF